ncbi:cGMP-dependent protein kinase, isozyme 1-like [Chrysoperla carnea]|uniref:cGMP-dependent protein kinase, isozyme 1-like n=1 Tax=Chrysoperla carnea TaxID=189513 RepID=UPI001D073AC2|nr:cGMP-dependent protein kinase, isozyme 1-like [Chrysoperla carnea]
MTSYNPLKNLLKLCQPVKKTRPMSERHVGTAPENVINDENLSSLHIEKIDKDDSSITLIKESIYGNEFLRVLLDEKRLKLVTDAMYLQSYAANANILTENEPGHQLFVSESGYFEVLKGGLTVKRFSSKEVFGELGVLYNCKRQATVRATTPAEVWVLDRQTFQKIMIYSDYQEHEEYVKFLSTVPGLQQLSSGVLFKLSELLEKEFFPSGNVIIRQGDYGDKFYIIRAGHVTVTKRFQNENGTSDLFDVSMGILSAGCFFGELALTKADCRQATVIAQAPGVECLTLERQAFEKYVGSLSKLVNKMYDVKLNDFSKILPTIKKDYTKHSLKDLTPIGILGVGGMASIHLVQSKKDRTKTYALKRIKKRSVELSKEREHIFNEKNVLFSCDTKFICQLYETYKDSKYLYFILEPCLGGDIWTLLNEEEYLDEKSSKFVVACVRS